MKYSIRLKNIPLFRYMPRGAGKVFAPYFKIVHFAPDTEILQLDGDVPGFYLIVEGDVLVYSKDYKVELNRLSAGNVFGEMSLVDNMKSSANLKTAEKKCTFVFCSKEHFHKVLSERTLYRAAFYRGAAELLSNRLRQQNIRVGEEIRHIEKLLDKENYEESLFAHLGQAKNSIQSVGTDIFSKLQDVMSMLKPLEKSSDKEASQAAKEMSALLTEVLKFDSQSFDIISQQLDQIHQYVENLRRVSGGQQLLEISGDQNIFYVNHAGETKKNEQTIFF